MPYLAVALRPNGSSKSTEESESPSVEKAKANASVKEGTTSTLSANSFSLPSGSKGLFSTSLSASASQTSTPQASSPFQDTVPPGRSTTLFGTSASQPFAGRTFANSPSPSGTSLFNSVKASSDTTPSVASTAPSAPGSTGTSAGSVFTFNPAGMQF